MKKYRFLILVFLFSPLSVYADKIKDEEDRLLNNFYNATVSRDRQMKCKATRDLLKFYKKVGNKNRIIMSQDILKRDCKGR